MKTDLTALQQKLANGEFLGFKLAEADGKSADKTSEVKLGAAKMAPTKTGLAKA